MKHELLNSKEIFFILIGTFTGFLARWVLLRKDYRQYPTFPNGYLIHLTTGFIAAGIGAVALPALLAKNFVAITFLALAIQQFRDIRKMERETLFSLDKNEYVPRGHAYIDGIAKTFEARNYVTMIVSLTTTFITLLDLFGKLVLNILAGLATGFIVFLFLKRFTKGGQIKDILKSIKEAELSFKDNNLYVDDIFVMNVGLKATQERILKRGLGVILTPKGENEAIILNHEGQKQAILHECGRLLGLERYIAARRDLETDRLAIVIVPMRKDFKSMVQIIEQVPILETNKKNEGA
ncbi:hypothetical protein BBF96_06885 [Anoxybacter fermentans]|uniref:YIEGIA protein n=1 Tax=Anoxybacter fermentans TaxID=1323375 RepID=A0A3Q9HQC1_9FIRM|nr:YIEGIA family protein [Anoxybacter fermentans]AZR73134.1 hypothetical protein BBF96_06885 [Anoxybacter fermentans]